MIAARGISVERRGRVILDGVDFAARSGEVTAILGANGAGKSTLLRVLTGDLRADQGSVEFGGRALASWDRRELARQRAVVAQSSSLAFPFSVIEVVLQGRAAFVRGRESVEDVRRALEALAAVDLTGFAERDYLTLSGGEHQRVHVARALAQLGGQTVDRCLFLDEPTASLDLRHQHEVLRLARQFAGAGGCVVVVLHDLHLCATYANQICLLRDGRVLESGGVDAVLREDALSKAFGVRVVRAVDGRPFFDVAV